MVHPKTGEILDTDIEISEITEFEKKLPWTLKTYLVKPIYATKIELKILKSTNIAREVQIGQFQVLTKNYTHTEFAPIKDVDEKKKKWLRAVSKSPQEKAKLKVEKTFIRRIKKSILEKA